MLRATLILLLALLSAGSICAQNIPAKPSHGQLAQLVSEAIRYELADKKIPALSIALVDGNSIVWAEGFGFADPAAKTPATAATVHRVGSVSKLFTDIALMQLVEQGKVALDVPVTRYLPTFAPTNRFQEPITLRMLMTHYSGIVRESPVGNYFDPTEPSLEASIASLNETEVIYAPGTRLKYSNAGGW
jgi:CubicO group peptidase (beta-lactamase class C family)